MKKEALATIILGSFLSTSGKLYNNNSWHDQLKDLTLHIYIKL